MAQVIVRLEGEGIDRLHRAAARLGEQGELEMRRGLSNGGRKLTTQVKRALVRQTNVKKRAVDRRVSGYYDAALNAYVIRAVGKGVTLDEVQGTRAGAYTPRDPRDQPRDARGRFAVWPNPKLARGLVSSAMWNNPRRFAWSYFDGRYRSAPPDKPRHTLYGPSVPKELVKGQSLAAFHTGTGIVLAEIERRIARVSGGVLSR